MLVTETMTPGQQRADRLEQGDCSWPRSSRSSIKIPLNSSIARDVSEGTVLSNSMFPGGGSLARARKPARTRTPPATLNRASVGAVRTTDGAGSKAHST